MKTIKSLKDITALEVGDVVMFDNLKYVVNKNDYTTQYYLYCPTGYNDIIFEKLNLKKRDFVEKLGINASYICNFPEVCSLEALIAIVSALFKEYEKQKELPKTWEEFCKRNPITPGKEAFINTASSVMVYEGYRITRLVSDDRNLCISKQEAEAFIALMQLRQLRKCYVGDWEPDWSDCRSSKFSITCIEGVLSIFDTVTVHRSMSFPNSKLAKQFFNNFKDLLEIAKPLL